MIASPLTWLAIHAAASVCGVVTAGEDAAGEGALAAGCGRAAGLAVVLRAPLNTRAVTATAAAMTNRGDDPPVPQHPQPESCAQDPAPGWRGRRWPGEFGMGFRVSLAGSSAPSSVPSFTSMLPGGARPSSSPTVATLRRASQRLTCHSRAHEPATINLKRLLVMNA